MMHPRLQGRPLEPAKPLPDLIVTPGIRLADPATFLGKPMEPAKPGTRLALGIRGEDGILRCRPGDEDMFEGAIPFKDVPAPAPAPVEKKEEEEKPAEWHLKIVLIPKETKQQNEMDAPDTTRKDAGPYDRSGCMGTVRPEVDDDRLYNPYLLNPLSAIGGRSINAPFFTESSGPQGSSIIIKRDGG